MTGHTSPNPGESVGTPSSDAMDLVGRLSLDQFGEDHFEGVCHDGLPLRAFGGQVAAQALTAAARTVPDGRNAHSLHGYFLRAGDTRRPIAYEVERLRDGGSYLSRRVTARQQGETIFALSASFKRAEPGGDRQRLMPTTPRPEELPDLSGIWAGTDPEHHAKSAFHRVLDLRYLPVPGEHTEPGQTEQKLWVRAADPLPDDPHLHACALAYASDLWLAPTVALAIEPPAMLRGASSSVFLTSLDHAIWYHRPFRADEWMLFAQRSPTHADGRGLAMADVWDPAGRLIATVVQETVIRTKRPTSSGPAGSTGPASGVGPSTDGP
ncbi:acyl-CoA thioesterase domain-containing protein [Streptomyces sp. NPDC005963]|uniref:acyl-CoA thioesterase n=1 Tax=Streptomyces sp. NPDC005963 TaxID=3156721 RepID=UPI0033C9E4B4